MSYFETRMGRPPLENKKETKSFRVDPQLWELVQAEAKSQGKRTTDIINESLARYVGESIRGGIDNEKFAQFLTRFNQLRKELGDMKVLLNEDTDNERREV